MKIGIVGAGGTGGYFGARLAASGCDVTWVARGAHLSAMAREGLRVKSQLGDVHVTPAKAVENAAEVGTVDLVMITVKLWDTEAAALTAKPMIGEKTAVMSLQNGVQKDEILRKVLGDVHLIGGLAYIEASIAAPGVIHHGGTMQKLVFGEFDGRRSRIVEELAAACRTAGIDVEASDEIEKAIWEKFVFLVGLSATTSVIRLPIGPIRRNPRTRALLLDVMREVVAVGRAKGIELAPDFAESRLEVCDRLPEQMTSSMHKDLEQGRRLEVDWLGGHVVELGRQFGVATPVNRVMSDALAVYAAGRSR